MPGLLDYHELRARISMPQVLRLLGFEPTKVRGAQWRGRCPVHDSALSLCCGERIKGREAASFSVHLGKQVYRCFQCGSGGNALDLWAAARRLPLYAAALELCEALGITPPVLGPSSTQHTSQHP